MSTNGDGREVSGKEVDVNAWYLLSRRENPSQWNGVLELVRQERNPDVVIRCQIFDDLSSSAIISSTTKLKTQF